MLYVSTWPASSSWPLTDPTTSPPLASSATRSTTPVCTVGASFIFFNVTVYVARAVSGRGATLSVTSTVSSCEYCVSKSSVAAATSRPTLTWPLHESITNSPAPLPPTMRYPKAWSAYTSGSVAEIGAPTRTPPRLPSGTTRVPPLNVGASFSSVIITVT